MNTHICHILNHLDAGGAEQYVVQLSNDLHQAGHRVSIVASLPHTLKPRLATGVTVENIQLHPGQSRSMASYIWLLAPAIIRLAHLFRDQQVDLVHTHLTASALPAWIAAKLAGIPVLHSKMHSEAVATTLGKLVFGSRLPLWLVDKFLGFTRYTEHEMRTHWRVPQTRILSSSIGIDTEHFSPPSSAERAAARTALGLKSDTFTMAVVARLHPEKDVELAVRAAMACDVPNAVLLIVGDGAERARLEAISQTLPGGSCIRFLGLLSDPRPVLHASDILLQTTRGPDLGMVVLEAMACGVPVLIAYRDRVEKIMARNTLEGRDIGLIQTATPEAMGHALADFSKDTTRRLAFSNEVRRLVEDRHARSKVYPALREAYAALIAKL
jgi:glycosyltransferase involved in cell wall biosynthesis